ncbi:hypothetical protein ACFZC6_01770 [Streptomyces ossamyceticus]|uniref:hypothetical protein n=1 Tax=Streptomyces ossamyceticus TaxID=249581 RepID=UPI0036EEF15B
MGKISRHGGASVAVEVAAAAEPVAADAAAADQPDDGLREAPGTGEPMQAVDGDEVTGDGSGQALPPVPDEAYGPDAVPLEGGEGSSPGTSSPASTEPQPTNSEPNVKPRRKPARKTASRSVKDPTESGSASLTAGEKTDESSAADGGEESS